MTTPTGSPLNPGRPQTNVTMATIAIMLSTTVVIMDINIAGIALPAMQGALSASQDQISWVMTTYFMAQGVTMAATGWLAGRLGRKRLYMGALIGFALCATMSGNATSLEEIIIWRGLQGMFSAPVVPISQALILDHYPRERHSFALALWGSGVMVAPVLGPVLGGYITEEYSWRWVFYLSLPFAILGVAGTLIFIREIPRDLSRRFDWLGFFCLALMLACLQFTLDRGEGEGWFDSDLIILMAVVIGLSFYLFVIHSMTTDNPFISVGILTNRNFMIGMIFMFLLGVLVMSINVIMPLFLQNVREFPVVTAGLTMLPRGLGTMFALILAGRLSDRVLDPRVVIFIGFLCVAYSAWTLSNSTTDVGYATFAIAGFFNGAGIGLVYVPLTTVSFWTLPIRFRTEASTLSSLVRNYGSGIGVSIVIGVLSRSQKEAHAFLAERISPYNELMRSPWLPEHWSIEKIQGLAALENEINRQALSIGFLNDFNLILIGAFLSMPLILLLSKGKPNEKTA
jgi:DHA2 family multidrug resistance protein